MMNEEENIGVLAASVKAAMESEKIPYRVDYCG